MRRNKWLRFGVAAALVAMAGPVSAYILRNSSGGACAYDGSACNVICDNGQLAGTMYWNGSLWSDGVRSNVDPYVVASMIVNAQGTACT